MDKQWELRLGNGKTAIWEGSTGEDAARRYLDCHPEAGSVVAFRSHPRHGVFAVDLRIAAIVE